MRKKTRATLATLARTTLDQVRNEPRETEDVGLRIEEIECALDLRSTHRHNHPLSDNTEISGVSELYECCFLAGYFSPPS